MSIRIIPQDQLEKSEKKHGGYHSAVTFSTAEESL